MFSTGRDDFSHGLAAVSEVVAREWCQRRQDLGCNTINVGLNSNGYGPCPRFDLWAEPQRVIQRAELARTYGLEPTWVLHDDAAISRYPVGRVAEGYAAHWRQVAPVLRPQVRVVVPAYEWNDHLTPAEQGTLLRLLAELFPDAYRLVSFTDDRWAVAPALSGHPDGPLVDGEEYPWWAKFRGIVHGLAFQCSKEQIDDSRALRQRLAEIVLRLNGTRQPDFPETERDFDNKYHGQPAGRFDVHLWEAGAEWVIKGLRPLAWTQAAGRVALTVPGVIGAGDGF